MWASNWTQYIYTQNPHVWHSRRYATILWFISFLRSLQSMENEAFLFSKAKCWQALHIFYIANQLFFWREKLIDLGTATASAQDKKTINNQEPQWDLGVANKNIFQTIVSFRIFLAAFKFQTYLEAYL